MSFKDWGNGQKESFEEMGKFIKSHWPICTFVLAALWVLVAFAGEAWVKALAKEVVEDQPLPQKVVEIQLAVQEAAQTAKRNEKVVERVEGKIDQLLLIMTRNQGGQN